jgi:hypothetical protein
MGHDQRINTVHIVGRYREKSYYKLCDSEPPVFLVPQVRAGGEVYPHPKTKCNATMITLDGYRNSAYTQRLPLLLKRLTLMPYQGVDFPWAGFGSVHFWSCDLS